MSVIAAFISTRDGTVASDGRRFKSVVLVNGVPTEPPSITADDFDKTFSLGDGKVVGAFCGLLEFSGATVPEHIRDITEGSFSGGTTLLQIVDLIEQQLTNRLNQIDDGEVIPPCRNVDLLLVGGAQLSRGDVRIAGIRFCGQPDGVTPARDIVSADKANRYYVYGEDLARAAAARTFDNNHVASSDSGFLMKLVRQAINAGIQNCGVQKHGTHRACGGQIFSARTWY